MTAMTAMTASSRMRNPAQVLVGNPHPHTTWLCLS